MSTTDKVSPELKRIKFRNKNIYLLDYENYEGVRRINIYVMRLFFALMFIFVATDSWTVILTYEEE